MPRKSGILGFCPRIGSWLPVPESRSISLRMRAQSLTLYAGIVGHALKVRRVDERVVVDLVGLPGPPGFLDSSWGHC